MASSIEKILQQLQQDYAEEGDVMDWDELSIDGKTFADNKMVDQDWLKLHEMSQVQAFAFIDCKLETVEKPSKPFEYIEVLDISGNKLKDLDFLAQFPLLVSLTCRGNADLKIAEIKSALKQLPNLKILEFDPDATFGLSSPKEVRDECFAAAPELLAVNNLKQDGEIFDDENSDDDEEEEEEEDEDDGGEWDEEAAQPTEGETEDLEEKEEDGEDDGEDHGEDDGEDDAEEPAAKKQRTEE